MHFVYKTDNLFQSIRISSGNSSVTKGFHFLNLIWTPDFLCVQNAPFKATSSFFNPFWLHLLFFMHLLIILSYKTLKLKSISNELWKGWKLAWYHHFIHIACARKLRGLRQKLDALRVQNGQSLSKYQGFIRILVSYKRISIFFKLFELNSFSVLKMHHSKPHQQFSTLSDFIYYFSCIYWLFWAIRPWNWKAFEMYSEKLPSWHGIIISPT